METIEKSISVDVPVSAVYNQWTQFESFPQFMDAVKEVRQLDDKRLHWKAEIGGKTKEWDAEIFEQIPDQRIAWRSISGVKNSGMVNFAAIGPDQTEVNLQLHYDPQGTTEHLGDALGVVSARISADLRRFKKFIEKRRLPTGGWRGEIHGKEVRPAGRLE
jgi:uncharacterized membrane protein